MTAHKDGHAITGGKGTDQFPHFLDARRIQTVGGLIQQQDLGLSQQGTGQSQPLLHAEGILGGLLVLLFFHPDDLQHCVDFFFGYAFEHSCDFQIFPSGKMAIIGRGFDEGTGAFQNFHPVGGIDGFSEHLHAA